MDRAVSSKYEPAPPGSLFGTRPVLLRRGSRLPRFEDPTWDLSAIQPQLHLKATMIHFGGYPDSFQHPAREFVRAELQDVPSDGEPPVAPETVLNRHYEIRAFCKWLEKEKVNDFGAVTDDHYRQYRKHLLKRNTDISPKVGGAMNTLWKYRGEMTRGLRADPTSLFKPLKRPTPKIEHAAPRIPEAVLTPLVTWAHRWVTVFAPDVIAAKAAYEKTRSQSFKKDAGAATRTEGHARLLATLAEYRRHQRPLPGQIRDGVPAVNMAHLARQSYCVMDVVQRIAKDDVAKAVEERGVDIDMPLMYRPTATLHDEPWLTSIPFWGVEKLVNNLVASCYVLIAMFSGMRDAQIKHLERGCLSIRTAGDDRPARYWVESLAFKNESDSFGTVASWRVGKWAAEAIRVLEDLQPADQRLLFARFNLEKNAREGERGANETLTANGTNSTLNGLVNWVNRYCASLGLMESIPPRSGEVWHLTTRQFRRTLAWFIARRPGGSIAGAIQYRHLSIQMFEGYAGTSQAGFRAEVEAEQSLMRGEHLLAMVDRHEHEELTGPAAQTARVRLEIFGEDAVFSGVVVESPGQMKKLMEVADPAIYFSDLVTCVFDPDKALCLRSTDVANRPTLERCDPFRCANVALTKSNIAGWDAVVRELDVLLQREAVLPPYVAARLKDARARAVVKFTRKGEAP